MFFELLAFFMSTIHSVFCIVLWYRKDFIYFILFYLIYFISVLFKSMSTVINMTMENLALCRPTLICHVGYSIRLVCHADHTHLFTTSILPLLSLSNKAECNI